MLRPARVSSIRCGRACSQAELLPWMTCAWRSRRIAITFQTATQEKTIGCILARSTVALCEMHPIHFFYRAAHIHGQRIGLESSHERITHSDLLEQAHAGTNCIR